MKELTQEYLKELFTYHDGNLYWKVNKPGLKIGDKAGSLQIHGYYSVGINYKQYYNHRLIYLYHYGYIPKYIDHIDNNSLNNKIENLRKVTMSQNIMNSRLNKNSSSQYKGVSWYKPSQKWRSRIKIDGKEIYLGSFDDDWTAAFIYNVYARGVFGKYANLNDLGYKNENIICNR